MKTRNGMKWLSILMLVAIVATMLVPAAFAGGPGCGEWQTCPPPPIPQPELNAQALAVASLERPVLVVTNSNIDHGAITGRLEIDVDLQAGFFASAEANQWHRLPTASGVLGLVSAASANVGGHWFGVASAQALSSWVLSRNYAETTGYAYVPEGRVVVPFSFTASSVYRVNVQLEAAAASFAWAVAQAGGDWEEAYAYAYSYLSQSFWFWLTRTNTPQAIQVKVPTSPANMPGLWYIKAWSGDLLPGAGNPDLVGRFSLLNPWTFCSDEFAELGFMPNGSMGRWVLLQGVGKDGSKVWPMGGDVAAYFMPYRENRYGSDDTLLNNLSAATPMTWEQVKTKFPGVVID